MVKVLIGLWGMVGLLGLPRAAERQAAPKVWKTDLRIRSFDLMAVGQGSLQATVSVVADGDDAARSARLELLLPVSVGLIRASGGCRASPAAVGSLSGRVTCELGDIPGRGVREVTVLTSSPAPRSGAHYAAVVLSDTPDTTPANNFAEREAP